jgi:hypothetical protein
LRCNSGAIHQLLVGWQNCDERKWNHSAEKNAADEPPEYCTREPRRDGGKQANRSQCGLHDRRPLIAGSKLSHSYFRSASHSRRMLNEINVDRSTGEQGTGKNSHEFRSFPHVDLRPFLPLCFATYDRCFDVTSQALSQRLGFLYIAQAGGFAFQAAQVVELGAADF